MGLMLAPSYFQCDVIQMSQEFPR
ncbi:hypothetical protein THICB330005 [Thiomonas sp. CB3]|nr:hypothetical protein THICB330005 [Thiomonas sp. CB3]